MVRCSQDERKKLVKRLKGVLDARMVLEEKMAEVLGKWEAEVDRMGVMLKGLVGKAEAHLGEGRKVEEAVVKGRVKGEDMEEEDSEDRSEGYQDPMI